MGKIVVLGSASAVPHPQHENTHLLFESGSRMILVDCPGTPIVRLERLGVQPDQLTDLILTHFHPDHVSGLGPLLMGLWLLGRKNPLAVHGLQITIEKARQMMELYGWQHWPGFFPVTFHAVPAEEGCLLLEDDDVKVISSPVQHLIPTLGLRFEFKQIGQSACYSCDTEPSPIVERLAHNVDVLIHESTGSINGHTLPSQAGEIAQKAGAGALYLIHYPPHITTPDELLEEARKTFPGPVFVTHDFQIIELNHKA